MKLESFLLYYCLLALLVRIQCCLVQTSLVSCIYILCSSTRGEPPCTPNGPTSRWQRACERPPSIIQSCLVMHSLVTIQGLFMSIYRLVYVSPLYTYGGRMLLQSSLVTLYTSFMLMGPSSLVAPSIVKARLDMGDLSSIQGRSHVIVSLVYSGLFLSSRVQSSHGQSSTLGSSLVLQSSFMKDYVLAQSIFWPLVMDSRLYTSFTLSFIRGLQSSIVQPSLIQSILVQEGHLQSCLYIGPTSLVLSIYQSSHDGGHYITVQSRCPHVQYSQVYSCLSQSSLTMSSLVSLYSLVLVTLVQSCSIASSHVTSFQLQ